MIDFADKLVEENWEMLQQADESIWKYNWLVYAAAETIYQIVKWPKQKAKEPKWKVKDLAISQV